MLVAKHGLTRQEAIKAYDFLQAEGIDAIPPLSIRASLEAMMVHKGVNETPNHYVDITRIAGTLPFADMMLIDGAKASDIREVELDKKYGATIYSGKRNDLLKLRVCLDALVNAGE